jgi:2-polyprenyl-3-methyl-5-hydroxy-6-metoxy-1,4-benzoquinol methylase
VGGGGKHLKIRQFTNNYSKFFPCDKDEHCLDIGPGKGEMLACLSSFGYRAIEAVDISESVSQYISELGYNITLTEDVSSFLRERSERYKLITMCDVVEHISQESIIEVMRAVRSSLKPGGVLIVQVPNMQSITGSQFMYDDFTHVMGYTERSLVQMLSIAGYTDICCYGFEMLGNSIKDRAHRCVRGILWSIVKIVRKLNGYMPYKISHPVLYAVVRK